MQLKITSYNIHKAIGLDGRFRPSRIMEVLAEYNSDVLLLQEVDEGAPRSKELNLAKEIAEGLGYPYYSLDRNVSLRKGYYGNATLSRFPIKKHNNINLTIGERKNRGCQHTTIYLPYPDLQIQGVEIFNLHLGLSARERKRQAQLLFDSEQYIDIPLGKPCIVGGDFNDWRSLLRTAFTQGKSFRCATDRMTKSGPSAIKTFPSFAPQGALDRIYYKGNLQLKEVYRTQKRLARVASDHLPISTTFMIHSDLSEISLPDFPGRRKAA